MANRTITIGSTKVKNPSLEVYRDVAIECEPNPNVSYVPEPMLSDFCMFLSCEYNYEPHVISTLVSSIPSDQSIVESDLYCLSVLKNQDYRDMLIKWNNYTAAKTRIAKLVNVKAIQNSLHNIFTWERGERILNPEFGTKLRQYLYQGITEATKSLIVAEIRNACIKWEPRVNIVRVEDATTTNDVENNIIRLEVVYTIPSLSEEQYRYSYNYYRTNMDY